MKREFFIVANSFAAPFFSDQSTKFVEAETPEAALETFAAEYKHPAGLYSAAVYESADSYHKSAERLALWLCNAEIEKKKATEGLTGYRMLSHGPESFEVNDQTFTVLDPKGGRIVESVAR